jgi:Peptidase family C25/CARDB
MKKNLLIILLVMLGVGVKAQYNNEWIDYSKTYYKLKVGSSGLHRISNIILQQAGLAGTPVEHFKLYRNGVEIPIYTSNSSGVQSGSDFLEFYGERNDGKADTKLYKLASLHLDNSHSLLTDTSAYFLTVDPTGNNLRMVNEANNVAGNTLPADQYFFYTYIKSYRQKINPGFAAVLVQSNSYVYSSSYDAGEGWSTNDIYPSTPLVETQDLYPSTTGPTNAVISVGASGNVFNARNIQVLVNGSQVINDPLFYFQAATKQVNIPVSLLGKPGGDQVTIRNTSTIPEDRMVVSNFKISYPRQFNFGGSKLFEFQLNPNPLGNYLEITNFNAGSAAPVLYDVTNGRRYTGDVLNGVVRFALKPSNVPRRMVLLNTESAEIRNVNNLQARNFVNYGIAANQGNYLIISHPKLYTGPGGNPVDNYRAYRASAQGGSYNPKVYDIDQLIDQFAFGIKAHPLSVKNFINYARNTFPAKPQYILLIGRGSLYDDFRTYESYPATNDIDLVPTFGSPGSDNILGSPNLDPLPDIPVGRIAAISGEEVDIYLQKVKEYEAVPSSTQNTVADKAWMKNAVHAIGGSDRYLQALIYGYMSTNKGIIEDTLKGAKVYTFSKNSALAIEQLTSQQLEALFREGLGLLTYFGHSSTNTLEFNIDDPEKYDNKGKYPLFIVNGCNAGNIFSYDTLRTSGAAFTLSERYVLTRDKGSIGFLASSHYGVVNYLQNYTTSFYSVYSRNQYGKSLGQVQRAALERMIQNTPLNDFYTRMHAEQINLHGDPAVKLYAADQPDYVIEDPMVKVSPTPVSVAEASFVLQVRIQNIGKAVEDSFRVKIQRQLPSGVIVDIFNRKIKATLNTDSLKFEVPINPLTDKGENKILVTLDADGEIIETTEANNTLTKPFVIIEDELRPVYPYNYGIVNKPNITFYASAANPFAAPRSYVMEVDTTELFNSGFKKAVTIQSGGGLLQFNVPSFSMTDSTVYYWRTSPVPNQGADYIWNSSSFVYLPNSTPGYNQSHYYQMKKNQYNNVELASDRSYNYSPKKRLLGLKTGLYPIYFNDRLQVTIDENMYVNYGCRYSSLQIVVYDKVTLQPWYNATQANGLGRFDSWPPCIHNDNAFEFPYADPVFRKRAIDLLESIPEGYYVSVTNFGREINTSFINEWMADTATLGSGKSLYHTLKKLGFADLDSFSRNLPFIFVTRKGNRNFPVYQKMGRNFEDYLEMEIEVQVSENEGTIESPWFGPALAWNRLRWSGTDINPYSDQVSIQVIGKDFNGVEALLGTINPANDTALSFIDAKKYPYLKLRMNNKDSLNGSPNQLRYWRLNADLPPEGAVAPSIYYRAKDTLEVGEPMMVEMAFKNISPTAFDSIKVQMVVTDPSNVSREIVVPKQKPLKEGDTLVLRFPVDTKNLVGENTVFINFNPNYAQPEQYLFNNFLYKSFYVKGDAYDPTLDVTFDGMRILNEDIVSAKPHILIKLTDNNKYMLLNDTSLMKVKVKFPNKNVKEFRFDNDTLKFTPAVSTGGQTDNTATLDFFPHFKEDGLYELIVTGSDRSGNASGTVEYMVAFNVVNKPMISNLLNYPNPFTTSTAFVFTITGNEVPQNMRIQILTITGKIVKEITKEELGNIRIGRNITEYKWDGTDQYGQKLANGVYLYRVITNLNGKSLDRLKLDDLSGGKYNDSSTDKYFKAGYGKMYLMR